MLSFLPRRWLALAVCGFIIAAIAGCAHQRRYTLPTRVNSYHTLYKNKEYARASVFVSEPEEFRKRVELISADLVVIEFQVIRLDISPEGTEAEVEVVRTYYLLPSVVVKQQRIMQKWKFDPERKDWFLISPY